MPLYGHWQGHHGSWYQWNRRCNSRRTKARALGTPQRRGFPGADAALPRAHQSVRPVHARSGAALVSESSLMVPTTAPKKMAHASPACSGPNVGTPFCRMKANGRNDLIMFASSHPISQAISSPKTQYSTDNPSSFILAANTQS